MCVCVIYSERESVCDIYSECVCVCVIYTARERVCDVYSERERERERDYRFAANIKRV